ncbi:MAG: hypothetical protein LIO43_06385, partial [Clostridiales bacterium]|nr:hypothetical protein [Clostridiales bacterium]
MPDTDNILKLSKIYNVSVDSILNCGEDSDFEKEKNTEKNYSVEDEQPLTENISYPARKKRRGWFFAAYPCIAVLITVAIGALFNKWAVSWIFLFTIPLFYTSIIAFEKKNPVIFCYPVLVLIIYLLGGFIFKLWHPLWIIFLTIPIY